MKTTRDQPCPEPPSPDHKAGGEERLLDRERFCKRRVDCEEGALGQSCEFSFREILALRVSMWPGWTISPRIPSLEMCGQGGPWRDVCVGFGEWLEALLWLVPFVSTHQLAFLLGLGVADPPGDLPWSPFLGSSFSFSNSGPGTCSALWWGSAWRLQSPKPEKQKLTQASVQLRAPQLILVGFSLSWSSPTSHPHSFLMVCSADPKLQPVTQRQQLYGDCLTSLAASRAYGQIPETNAAVYVGKHGLPWWLGVNNPPAVQKPQEIWVWCLGQGDPLGKGMATHSSIPAWSIPWTEEPGGATVYRIEKSWTRLEWLSMHVARHPHTNASICTSPSGSACLFLAWIAVTKPCRQGIL